METRGGGHQQVTGRPNDTKMDGRDEFRMRAAGRGWESGRGREQDYSGIVIIYRLTWLMLWLVSLSAFYRMTNIDTFLGNGKPISIDMYLFSLG